MTRVENVKAAPDEAGMRVDRWFKARFPDLPHSQLSKLMRTGQIRVNGKRVKGKEKLREGDEIRIPPITTRRETSEPKPLSAEEKDEIRSMVIMEDRHVIVLNKPPGLAVQGGTRVPRHVDRYLRALKLWHDKNPPKLVHRLDKGTSGCLVVARTSEAARLLTQAFRERKVEKVYWALIKGVPESPAGRIKAPLKKSRSGGRKKMVVDHDSGKPAETYYQVIDKFGNLAAWVALVPVTGRTHQLRAHMAHFGHPIFGDKKYGFERSGLPKVSKKLHLHAKAIFFPHPGKNYMMVKAPLPEHMLDSFKLMGFDPNTVVDPFAGLKP